MGRIRVTESREGRKVEVEIDARKGTVTIVEKSLMRARIKRIWRESGGDERASYERIRIELMEAMEG